LSTKIVRKSADKSRQALHYYSDIGVLKAWAQEPVEITGAILPTKCPGVVGICLFATPEIGPMDAAVSRLGLLDPQKCVKHLMKHDIAQKVKVHEFLVEQGMNPDQVLAGVKPPEPD